jgi:hypothetical protein
MKQAPISDVNPLVQYISVRIKDVHQSNRRTSKVQCVFHCNVTSDKRLFVQEQNDARKQKQKNVLSGCLHLLMHKQSYSSLTVRGQRE